MWTKLKNSPKALRRLRLLAELLLLGALVFMLTSDYRAALHDPFRQQVTLIWHLPSGELRQQRLRRGSRIPVPEGEALEGYTFLGWRDAQGALLHGGELTVYEDRSYAASYALALETQEHIPYLDTDRNGLFHPHRPLTRREAAVMLYRLLDTQLVGDGSFADLDEKDPCHAAAATLKTLGLISGSYFHAEDAVSRAELLGMLATLYPPAQERCSFRDLPADDPRHAAFCLAVERGWLDPEPLAEPEKAISRAETAKLMNRLLGRDDAIGDSAALVGTIPDLSLHDAYFRDVAEAVIPHEHTPPGEDFRWTESRPLPLREPGFYFIEHRLRCIDEDGSPVVGRQLGLLQFNEEGEISSGLPELDALLVEVLCAQLEAPLCRDMEQLRLLFDYTAESFTYLPRSSYESGETGWEAQEAYTMLRTGEGNCYNFAAVFGELARFLGFDAQIYSGTISGTYKNEETLEIVFDSRRPHAWVEIELEDEWRIFDPEYAFSRLLTNGDANFFNRGDGIRKQYNYRR